MKFLRSPWVTGALVVVAVAVVIYQILPQLRSRRPTARPAPSASSASKPPNPIASAAPKHSTPRAPASPVANNGPDEASEPAMNRLYLEGRFAGWVTAPQRDPFLLVAPRPAQKGAVRTNSLVATWKLTGIWNQPGSRLAVINNKVYSEGDEIQGFQVHKIDGDVVWFNGTNGLERLTLGRRSSAVPAAPTNAPLPK